MSCALLAVEQAFYDLVLDHDARPHGRGGVRKYVVRRAGCLARERNELHASIAALCFVQAEPSVRAVTTGPDTASPSGLPRADLDPNIRCASHKCKRW